MSISIRPEKSNNTQTAILLCDKHLTLNELKPYLDRFIISDESSNTKDWTVSGSYYLLKYDEKCGLLVDIVNQKWPDKMGINTSAADSDAHLVNAWLNGSFGECTYSNCLQRAIDYGYRWDEAANEVLKHRSFVRLRLMIVLKGITKAISRPVKELQFITSVAQALLRHPSIMCYFIPGGEVLLPKTILETQIEFYRDKDYPPIHLWVNTRWLSLDNGWSLMDTVGNRQFDMPDHQLAFPNGFISADDAMAWVIATSINVLRKSLKIQNGVKVDGWIPIRLDCSVNLPPREVILWIPENARDLPELLIEAIST